MSSGSIFTNIITGLLFEGQVKKRLHSALGYQSANDFEASMIIQGNMVYISEAVLVQTAKMVQGWW